MAVDDVSRVLSSLQRLNNTNDTVYVCSILSKVMSLHAKGFDVREALPKIVKLLANQDLVIKKALYNILATYSLSDPDVILLATNTLLQECSDSNPMVRGLAVSTICSFNHETFLEYGIRSVVGGLKDSSAYVRRAAICGCGQLNLRSSGICQEHGLVDKLYRSIRDTDPVVMVNAVVVLEEILKKEGGIIINKNMAHFILGKIETLTPWGITYIFQILQKYQPKSEDEIFDILNVLDPFLTHNNHSVSTSCFELFLHFVKELPSLRTEVFKRCFNNLVNVIGSGNPEVVFCIIELFEKYIEDSKEILITHYKTFACKQKEPTYLKSKKINLMKYLLTEENVMEVLDEMQFHSSNSDETISLNALKVIAFIYQNYSVAADKCGTIFKQLLQSNVSKVTSNCLHVLQSIDLGKSGNCGEFIAILCDCLNFVNDERGICALLMLLGNYSNHYADTPYVIEDFLEAKEQVSTDVKTYLLHCCLKVFFYYPAACQHLLGKVFEICSEDEDECLKDMSTFYYFLLQTDIEEAKHVIMNCQKLPCDESKIHENKP